MTDTADLADYVLPATTQLEHLDVHRSYGHTYALINHPAIAPVGEAKPNTEVFRELARRMGFTEPCFVDSDETLARAAFRAERVDFEALAERGWVKLAVPELPFAEGGFATADGRAHRRARRASACPTTCPTTSSAQSTPGSSRRATRWR